MHVCMTFRNSVHRMVKVCQDETFNSLHSLKDPTTMLLQFDFSENAEIQEQDEVQSAHWWHLQVTLFTACAWVNCECTSFTVISDYIHHDKYMTVMAILNIMGILLDKYKTVINLNLFSDGAAQHFKQRFFWNAVTMLPELIGVSRDALKIVYDLFATSHGKGAVDGVGGTVKRQVMAEVITKKVIIKTAEDYADTAETVCPGVTIIHISKEEVLGMKEQLDEEVFTDTRTLNGTRKVHHLEVVGPSKVEYYPFKGSSIKKVHNFK